MNSFCLNIAGYKICFESSEKGPDLVPGQRFKNYLCSEVDPDLFILVHSDPFIIPADAERVFHAPLVEEIDNTLIKTNDNFWSIYKNTGNIFIKTTLPYSTDNKEAIVRLSLSTNRWDLFIKGGSINIDPFEYPLDGLILYYWTAKSGDIMIHASGVNHSGNGLLFSGISGKGKSTMAGLWKEAGADVIHDDRLIIRCISDTYKMFNTPIYNYDKPKSSALRYIYLIEHGPVNKLVRLREAEAVSHVMANCIQQNWNPDIIKGLINNLSDLCSHIPVFRLSFIPDRSITEFLPGNEE
jgi:hypothetical protein